MNLLMADSVNQFIKYYSSQLGTTAVFQMYQDDRVMPIGYRDGAYYLPDDLDIKFYGDTKQIKFALTKRPPDVPRWENDVKKAIDRDVKGDLAIVPYSHSQYGRRAGIYELRLYNLNGIPVELMNIGINYYNRSGSLQSRVEYNSERLVSFMPNNVVFDMAVIGMNNFNNYSKISGNIEFRDINGNLINKEFEFEPNVNVPVKYVQ